jgi:two-component system, OmpR family, sensor histidine kinase TctE
VDKTPDKTQAAAAGNRPGAALSLKRQLLLWLLVPQLVLWLAGGLLAYRIALSYAEQGIDQSLTQSVRSLARQVKPIGSGLLIDFPKAAQAIIEEEPDDRVSYMVSSPPGSFVLGNTGAEVLPEPPNPLVNNEPVLYNAVHANTPIRVAAIELNYGDAENPQRMRVQVAKSRAARDRIARSLIYDMLVPLLVLGGVLGALVYAGVTRGLQPLQRLAAQLGEKSGEKSATGLAPIEMRDAPQEVHALAGAVNQLLAAVERSVSQEKRFLNDAAHQLRTPLAGLKSQLELALAEAGASGLHERLRKVNAGVERSSHLVHQLLSLARSEADIPLAPLDATQLAREVAREVAPRALAADLDFGFEGDKPLWVRGNALLLREALSNLIDNAIRYAGSGASVTLRCREEHGNSADAVGNASGAQVVLEVEDTGPGVKPHALERVFERFYRASDQPGGAGLGLAIVKEIAQRHQGQARALAAQPQGLCIQLRLQALLTPSGA